MKFTIFDKDTKSSFRKAIHLENGVVVPKCTKGGTTPGATSKPGDQSIKTPVSAEKEMEYQMAITKANQDYAEYCANLKRICNEAIASGLDPEVANKAYLDGLEQANNIRDRAYAEAAKLLK